jgi:hypothetical protein
MEQEKQVTWRVSLPDIRRRVKQLDFEKTETVQAMRALAKRYEHTFSSPRPVYLVMQRLAQGHVYLRWRLPACNGHQPFIDFTSDEGWTVLHKLPGEVRQMLLRYVREVAELNLAHSLRQGEWLRLRRFMADNEKMSALSQAGKPK